MDLDECDQSMECGDCTLYWYCEQVGEVPYYPCELWFDCPNRNYVIAMNSVNDQADPCDSGQSPAVWQSFSWQTAYPGFPISYNWNNNPICQDVEITISGGLTPTTCTFNLNCF